MLSIVTGTLNRLELLKLVIQNTVDKSDKLELILLDGGSTDGTIEYVKSLNNNQINLIEIGGRSSYPSFMNIGIKESKYHWIAQWNDDVLLINEWDDIFPLIDDGGYDAYIFDWTRGTLDDYYKCKKFNIDPKEFGSYWIRFHDCMNFGIYKKNIFRDIGLYDNQFKYYECDHDMTTRCIQFGYKVINMNNIKVFELNTEKRSITYTNDRFIFLNNLQKYKQKILPDSIEKL